MTQDELRIGVFVCECGLNIAGSVDCEEVRKSAEELPDVVVSIRNKYTCADPGQEEIKKYIREYNLNRVVVASCSPRMHELTFRNCVAEAELNPYLLEMASIREQCSWVHLHDREAATQKARDIVKIAVARARLLQPHLEPRAERRTVLQAGDLPAPGRTARFQLAPFLRDGIAGFHRGIPLARLGGAGAGRPGCGRLHLLGHRPGVRQAGGDQYREHEGHRRDGGAPDQFGAGLRRPVRAGFQRRADGRSA